MKLTQLVSITIILVVLLFIVSKYMLHVLMFNDNVIINAIHNNNKLTIINKLFTNTTTTSITTSSSSSSSSSSSTVFCKKDQSSTKECQLHFPPTCLLNPRLIKYWDETTPCYTSPLRQSSGLSNPNIEERRYVVMQPDLGGWNNIRMALEFGILFALVTGRIFVLPPPAVFYLLHMNKKWKDNFSTYTDYLDFKRLMVGNGLEIITMKEFLETIAARSLLSQPLPNNNTDLAKKPLWDYLESACYVRQWSPGKIFLGFNITSRKNKQGIEEPVFGTFDGVSPERWKLMTLDGVDRQMIPYDAEFHKHRVIYFPGHDKNRLLTHFYSFMFFAEPSMERLMKRFVRDRMRYLDEVYCAAGRVIGLLHDQVQALKPVENQVRASIDNFQPTACKPFVGAGGEYIAFHVRRGDFQHKQTQWSAEKIIRSTARLIDDSKERVLYISTDEGNQSFFEPFHNAFKKVFFLKDFTQSAGLEDLNPNHIGMVEQVICANAHTFIGTPLSTFTAFITRMRGYSNRTLLHDQLALNPVKMERSVIDASAFEDPHLAQTTAHGGDGNESEDIKDKKRKEKKKPVFGKITPPFEVDKSNIYARSYYYMERQMFQLQYTPRLELPFWIRDFIDAFYEAKDDE